MRLYSFLSSVVLVFLMGAKNLVFLLVLICILIVLIFSQFFSIPFTKSLLRFDRNSLCCFSLIFSLLEELAMCLAFFRFKSGYI